MHLNWEGICEFKGRTQSIYPICLPKVNQKEVLSVQKKGLLMPMAQVRIYHQDYQKFWKTNLEGKKR